MKKSFTEFDIGQLTFQRVTFKSVTWAQAEPLLRAVRTVVFIDEQLVTPEFEWDDIDAGAVHLLAMAENQAIACLRIIEYTKIGRMAVLKQWRKQGVGIRLLKMAIEICRQHGSKCVKLSAQTHAIGFYEKAGFVQVSDEYCDVDIPHVDMQLDL
ncbi:MAG TPA: GNAT family N-acetyltransferase [Methylotenera sp.]|nr:GNAT family N-acetyltransferase [Methylotenera sp.]HPH04649.1 GNAT family N-acetyltransferase [Methylotenera sp.]HPN01663.1 GNAT family N-acetyltransferase [Methylotenera sp.]